MTGRPDWEQILLKIYEEQNGELDVTHNSTSKPSVSRKSVASDMGLNELEKREAFDFMHKSGLIAPNRNDRFQITPKGFEVAHELRMLERQEEQQDDRSKQQRKVNMAVGYLTVGLLAVNSFSPIIVASDFESPVNPLYFVGVNLVAVIVVLYYLWKSELLNPDIIE